MSGAHSWFYIYVSYSVGIWTLRLFKHTWQLKAPWAYKYFSECEGRVRTLWSLKHPPYNWRILYRGTDGR